LKLLIFGIDAADPEIILNNRNILPNLDKLCTQGAYGRVQSLFYSCDIWTSFYTGLRPEKHGVQYLRLSNPKANQPVCLTAPHYLWNTLNQQSVTFGMIEGLYTYPAPVVDGFFWSGKPRLGNDYAFPACIKDFITEGFPKDLLPPPISAYGIREPFASAPVEKLQKILEHNYYADYQEHLTRKLRWYREKIRQLYKSYPVDVLFYYTTDLDLFGHFTQHPACLPTTLQTYQVLDRFLGKVIEDCQPESVLFLSDHGMQPTAKVFDPKERASIMIGDYQGCKRILPDGTYVTPWTNQSLATGVHSDIGFYAFCGPQLKENFYHDISYLQVYPAILQALGLIIPSHVETSLPDIFESFSQKRADGYTKLQWANDQGLLGSLLSFTDLQPEDEVLDLGTGTGLVAAALQERLIKVTGVDSSWAMIEKARQMHPNLNLCQADIRALPYADGVFHKAIARMVLHHIISDLPEVMAEIFRVLRLGGEVIICEGIPPLPELLPDYKAIFSLKEIRQCFLPKDLRELLRQAGFVEIIDETFIVSQVSVGNWLEQSGLPELTRKEIYRLHSQSTKRFKEAYNLVETEKDIFIDMTFLLIKGKKPL
jgi:ubiquinone/menaquinone biosynthesis C-methylase UbiE